MAKKEQKKASVSFPSVADLNGERRRKLWAKIDALPERKQQNVRDYVWSMLPEEAFEGLEEAFALLID